MKKLIIKLALRATLLGPLAAYGQSTTTPPSTPPAPPSEAGPGIVDPGHPRVNQVNHREENQQDRIAQGVKSGALTPGETSRLEKGEARLQNRESKDMAKDNGHLTKQNKEQLNREENRLSHRIHHDKHNEHEAKK